MWPYRLSLEVTTLASLVLGLLVLLQNRRARISQVFFAFSILVTIYSFFLNQTSFARSQPEALLYGKLMYLGVILIPPVYYQLTLLVTRVRSKLLPLFYGLAFFFLALLPTPFLVSGTRYFDDYKIYSQFPGGLYHIFVLIFFTELFYSWYIALKAYKSSVGLQKTQLGYFIFGSGIGFVGGIIDFLPKYGLFIPYLNTYCNYLITLYIFSFAYAIIKYRLMDIQVVIYRGLVYSILIALLTAVYLFVIFATGQLFQSWFGLNPIWVGGTIILALTFAFLPVKNRAQNYIDKLFFKNKYEYQQTLKHLSQISTTIISLEALVKLIIDRVTEVVNVRNASVLVVNPRTSIFNLVHSKKGGK